MKVQILGSGCAKCQTLAENAKQAVEELKLEAEIVKVTDSDEIMEMGVMITPALAINDDVKSVGAVLKPAQIVDLLKSEV